MKNLTELVQEAQSFIDRNYIAPKVKPMVFYQMDITPGEIDLEADLGPTFSQVLFKYIREKGISETECYKRSNIDRRLFSKIRSDKFYQPDKSTILALIIGLRLTREEANELLDVAGYSLSRSIKQDLAIIYLLQKEIYDINVVNEVLDSLKLKTLGAK